MPLFETDAGSLLFIHVPKTGGTSIQKCLGSFHRHSRWTNDPLPGEPCTPQHYSSELLTERHREDDLIYSFMMVRHPVDRLVSEYNWQMRKRLIPTPFAWWLRMVLKKLGRDRYCFDNHIRPQSEFACFNAEVYRYEDGFESIIERLSGITGLDYGSRLQHYKRSVRAPVQVEQAERSLIEDTYDVDYERFGYDR